MAVTKKRLIVGAIFSPLAVPILYFLGVYFLSGYTDQGPGHVEKLFQLTLGFIIDSYALSLGLGGLLLVFLYRFNKINVFNCIVFSIALGALGGFIFAVFTAGTHIANFYILFSLVGSIAGFFTSITFCVLAGVPRSFNECNLLGH